MQCDHDFSMKNELMKDTKSDELPLKIRELFTLAEKKLDQEYEHFHQVEHTYEAANQAWLTISRKTMNTASNKKQIKELKKAQKHKMLCKQAFIKSMDKCRLAEQNKQTLETEVNDALDDINYGLRKTVDALQRKTNTVKQKALQTTNIANNKLQARIDSLEKANKSKQQQIDDLKKSLQIPV
jgi:dGTP triphosphohydrolase